MKKFLLPALFAIATIGATSVADPAYKLQPQLSTLGWEGKAVTHGHNGTMNFSSGELLVKGSSIVGGTVTVDMKTMKATDIKDAESQGKFVGHMSSDDFFGVEKFPTSTFKIASVTPIKGAAKDADNVTIAGDLTIKGVTQRISFPAKAGVKDGVAAATGKVTIDRTKFGLKYGSKSFFESIGDKAIYDTFDLTFNVIAKKA
jgi:polyisoprenoid-binding protein YceI